MRQNERWLHLSSFFLLEAGVPSLGPDGEEPDFFTYLL
jgi:hypothetical protein